MSNQQIPPDPFAALETMMAGVPGGSYLIEMLRNNPEAQDALRSIDPARPETMREGMRKLLGVFGMAGPMADTMLDQAMSTMGDPAAMKAMAAQHGVPMPEGAPFAAAQHAAQQFEESPTIDADYAAGAATTSAAAGDRLPWLGLAVEASRLIGEGSERTAFEKVTAALDDERSADYDPRQASYDDLTALLEVYAIEAELAGRQIPVRFAPLFSRAALHAGVSEPAPAQNPEFSAWCAEIGEALSGSQG